MKWREEWKRKRHHERNNQTRIACINIRSFWRRRLFTDERGGKKCEGTKRWDILGKKVWRSFEMSKQKDYKYSWKTGRVVKKIQGEWRIFWLCWSGLSRSNMYFKISLYKFLCKFPVLKKSTLTSSYFNSNFKLIKKVGKANANIFGEKKYKIFAPLFFIFFILVWIILFNLEIFFYGESYSWKILSSIGNFFHWKS